MFILVLLKCNFRIFYKLSWLDLSISVDMYWVVKKGFSYLTDLYNRRKLLWKYEETCNFGFFPWSETFVYYKPDIENGWISGLTQQQIYLLFSIRFPVGGIIYIHNIFAMLSNGEVWFQTFLSSCTPSLSRDKNHPQ